MLWRLLAGRRHLEGERLAMLRSHDNLPGETALPAMRGVIEARWDLESLLYFMLRDIY